MTALDRLYVDGEILLYGDVGDPWGWGDGFTPTDVAQALALHGDADITARLNSGEDRRLTFSGRRARRDRLRL